MKPGLRDKGGAREKGGHRLPETGEASHIKTWTCFTMETQGN